jgi:hypothetical protein
MCFPGTFGHLSAPPLPRGADVAADGGRVFLCSDGRGSPRSVGCDRLDRIGPQRPTTRHNDIDVVAGGIHVIQWIPAEAVDEGRPAVEEVLDDPLVVPARLDRPGLAARREPIGGVKGGRGGIVALATKKSGSLINHSMAISGRPALRTVSGRFSTGSTT